MRTKKYSDYNYPRCSDGNFVPVYDTPDGPKPACVSPSVVLEEFMATESEFNPKSIPDDFDYWNPLPHELIIDGTNDKVKMPAWITVGSTKLLGLDALSDFWNITRSAARKAMISLGVPCLGFGQTVRYGLGEANRKWFINPWELEKALWKATGGDVSDMKDINKMYKDIEKTALIKWLKGLTVKRASGYVRKKDRKS